MAQFTTHTGRNARWLAILASHLLVTAIGTASAHGGGSYSGGMVGGALGLFGWAMELWGFLWMGLLIAGPLYIVYELLNRGSGGNDERPLSVLRERYARGELSDEEFESRRTSLIQWGLNW